MSTEAKKERDRERQRRIYQEYVERRLCAIKSFGGKCQHCHNVTEREDLQFHHVIYDEVESNYSRKRSVMSIRLKSLAEVEAHPERFKLLCTNCHNAEHDRLDREKI